MFAAPFAPFLHRVVDRCVAEAGERNVAARFDLMDDRALVDKAHVEVEDIMTDEEIAVRDDLPEVFDDIGFFALQDFDGAAERRFDGVAETNYFCRQCGQAEFFYQLRFIEFNLRVEQTIFLQRFLRRHGFDVEVKNFHGFALQFVADT